MCAALALTAGAAEPPERGAASAAAAVMSEKEGAATPAHSGKGGGSKRRESAAPVAPNRRSGQLARSNTDRLNALLSARARGRIASPSSRIGSTQGAIGNGLAAEARSASVLKQHTLPIYKSSAHAASSLNPAAKGSTIGGPHAAVPVRLGGPATPRTANSATLNGSQLHRKF